MNKLAKFQILLALTAGFALIIIFFWHNLFTPVVNITPSVGTNDFMDLNVPFRFFLNKSLQAGQIPLWSSEISSGYPILAEGQIGALYPLNLAFYRFDTLLSANLTFLTTYLLLFSFSFLYLRKIKIGFLAAVFGAIGVTFSGFAVNELLHFGILISFAFFVGQLYFLELFLQTRKFYWLLGMSLLLGISILGGHPQIIFYSLLFLIPYWLIFWTIQRRSFLAFIFDVFIFGILGLGIGAGQFLPQAEFTLNSTRASGLSAEAINRFSFPISDIKTYLLPFSNFDPSHTLQAFSTNGWPTDERYVYPGIIVLGLSLAGLLIFRRRNIYTYLFVIFAGAGIIFSFGGQFITGYILTLPPFSFFRIPFRILFIVNFSLAVLASLALDKILERFGEGKSKLYLKILILTVVGGLFFVDVRYNAKKLYPEVDARDWYQEPKVVETLKANLSDNLRVTDEQYFYPSIKILIDQPELWDNFNIHKNLRNLLPVFNNLLYSIPKNVGAANSGGLKVSRYNDLETEIFFEGLKFDPQGRASVTDAFIFLNKIMGVRYFLSTEKLTHYSLIKAGEYTFKTGQDPVFLYEIFDYYPRIFMVGQSEKAEPEEILNHLFKVDFDPMKVVYTDVDTNWGAKGGYSATAQFVKYGDQEVIVSTQASGDGFLFLSDTYYPGWKAYVDGKETPIYRADYAFRAVPVPEGEHTVIFRYEPASFYWGIRLTVFTALASLFGIVVLVILDKTKHPKRDAS